MPGQDSSADRYKAAMEKARAEHTQSDIEPPSIDENPRTERPEPGITYSQTKVVPVTKNRMKRSRIVAPHTGSRESDIFRLLRTQVIHRMHNRDARTLAICSANIGEGKTFVAINLALSLAMDLNHTVMLVDLDLRRPSIHKFFGLQRGKSLVDVLTGEASIADCLVNPDIDRLVILPTYSAVPHSSDVLTSPEMVKLATELRERYRERIVIYDLPPMLLVDDCIAFIDHVDVCMFVVEEGLTKSDEITRALSLIKDEKLIGTILNKSKGYSGNTYVYY